MIFAIITICIFSIIPTCITWGIVRLLEKIGLGFIIVGINFLILIASILLQFDGYSINGGSVTAGFELFFEFGLRKALLLLSIIQFITALSAINQKETKKDNATNDKD